MIVKYSLSLDSDDDFRSGCRNVSHHYRKQSFSGLHSLGRSNYTITFYILPMQYEYFTRSENRSLLSQTPLGGGRQGETGGDRGRQGEAGGDRGWWDKCKTEFSLAPFPCDPRGSLAINDERFLGNGKRTPTSVRRRSSWVDFRLRNPSSPDVVFVMKALFSILDPQNRVETKTCFVFAHDFVIAVRYLLFTDVVTPPRNLSKLKKNWFSELPVNCLLR